MHRFFYSKRKKKSHTHRLLLQKKNFFSQKNHKNEWKDLLFWKKKISKTFQST